ncbi:UV radiation resistance protein and autophagy-related subunit 14-domain-containing protein [Panaeolus papilionaceus]|nr:UV radiation resistance protein and autophagy-related subunit 14-domain-containing protein [Panaeolus papilionaceus]
MDCKICELPHRQFYCETCIRTHEQGSGDVIAPARISRARLAETQLRVEEVRAGLVGVRRDNERKRDRLRALRETLASRRRTLSLAKLQSSASSSPNPSSSTSTSASPSITSHITDLFSQLTALSQAIARARAGLVQELVEVFNIVEVGGRPPIGGKAGTKGEWTIGDLILPVPGDMRRYPPDHINAVLTHTIHFLTLLTFYLGIKLPFEIVWTGARLGLGQPWIGAIRGPEGGGWARWYNKHPLHLSASPTPPPPPPSSSSSSSKSRTTNPTSPTSQTPPNTLPTPTINPSTPSFTTALSMLLYNTTYLAHTQSIHIPLSQVGDVLSNLWTVCCSSELGRWSHETWPMMAEALNPPPPPGIGPGIGIPPQLFTLEFGQVVQAMMRGPVTKARGRGSPSSSSSSSSGHRKSGSMGKGGSEGVRGMGRIEEGLREEEEDGWDLVDDDV